jgi:hypothetical protein
MKRSRSLLAIGSLMLALLTDPITGTAHAQIAAKGRRGVPDCATQFADCKAGVSSRGRVCSLIRRIASSLNSRVNFRLSMTHLQLHQNT